MVSVTVNVPPSEEGRNVTVLPSTCSLLITGSLVNWTVGAGVLLPKIAVSDGPGTPLAQLDGLINRRWCWRSNCSWRRD